MDDNALEQLIVPLVDLVRAGGGVGGGSSASGGSRGVAANSAAAVATATCIFLSLLVHASAPSYSSGPAAQAAAPHGERHNLKIDYLFICLFIYYYSIIVLVCSAPLFTKNVNSCFHPGCPYF